MLSVLFTPGVRERLSRVRVPRALSGVPGRGVFGPRPSVYSPLSFTGHAVICLRSIHGAYPGGHKEHWYHSAKKEREIL